MNLSECRVLDLDGLVHNGIKNDVNHAFHTMCMQHFRLDAMQHQSALPLWQEVALQEQATCLLCIERGDETMRKLIKGRFDMPL